MIADIGHANRVDLMENPHLAASVPPELGEPIEARDVFGVDAGGMGSRLFGQKEAS
jgi:hypothetical protein